MQEQERQIYLETTQEGLDMMVMLGRFIDGFKIDGEISKHGEKGNIKMGFRFKAGFNLEELFCTVSANEDGTMEWHAPLVVNEEPDFITEAGFNPKSSFKVGGVDIEAQSGESTNLLTGEKVYKTKLAVGQSRGQVGVSVFAEGSTPDQTSETIIKTGIEVGGSEKYFTIKMRAYYEFLINEK